MTQKDYDVEWRQFEANDGAKISYRVLGNPENPHVMLIHGWGVTGEYWRPQYFLSEHLYLVIPDLRGYGESESKPPFTISRMAVDLLDLARREDVPFIVGHSMGGAIAQQLASNFPEHFEGVVLAATFARFGTPFSAKFFETAIPLINKIDLRSFAKFASNMAYNVDKRTKLFFYRFYVKCRKEVLLENAKDILRYDGTWNLPSITSPVLIIHGDHDPVISTNQAEYIADHIEDSHVVIMREAGHEINFNDPELFNMLVYGFVRSVHDGLLKQ